MKIITLLVCEIYSFSLTQNVPHFKYYTSSNINEVIRPVLNFLFFFYDKISQVQKSTKKHQKALKNI